MKTSSTLRSILLGSILLTAPTVYGASVTWDANAAGALQTDGAGAWLTANQWWTGLANATWTSGDDAIFGNGGAGGAVTLASPTTVGSLTLNSFTGTYTLGTAGQTITLSSGITMNAGAGAATIISPVTLGGAQSWTNNSGSLLTIGTGAVTNGGFLQTINGTGNTTISSVIGGAGGLTKSGAGTLTLSGANTFTGQLTVANGTLSIASINNNNANGVLGNSGINQPVILGSSGQTGTLLYTAASGSSDRAFNFAAAGTGEINVSTALTLSGHLYGSGNLLKTGAGTLTLTAPGVNNYNQGSANQLSGTTQITAGKILLTQLGGGGSATTWAAALWKSAYDTTGSTGGTVGLDLGTTGSTLALGGLAGNVNTGTAILTPGFMSSLVLNNQQGVSVSYGGIISNGAAGTTLIKIGEGTQTLTNANSYTGATTVGAGKLVLSGANGSILTSASVTVRGGILELDNSGGTWINRIADANALSLGSLTLKSFDGAGVQTETVGTTTFAVSGKVTINNGATLGDQTTLALSTGNVVRSAGAAIDFVGTNGTLGGGANSPNVTAFGFAASAAEVNGILPWATVGGTQWAEDNANSIRAYSGTFNTDLTTATNSQNAQTTGSLSLTGAAVANSLNIITSGSGGSLSLGSNNLTLGSVAASPGAILKSGTDAYTISGTGQVRAGSAGAGTELIAHVDGGALTISAPLATAIVGIAKGGTGDLVISGTHAATMSGAFGIAGGTLEFQGAGFTLSGAVSGAGGLTVNLNPGQVLTFSNNANSYTGPTVVKGGVLKVDFNANGLPGGTMILPGYSNTSLAGSNLVLNGGVFVSTYGFARTLGAGPDQVQILAGTSGLSATGGGGFSIDNGRELVWGSTYFQPTTFVLGDANLAAAMTLPNGIDLAGSTRTISQTSTSFGSTISGAIRSSSGTAGLTKTGVGTLTLSGANTYNGATTVSQGVLVPNTIASLPGYNASGRVVFDGGTLSTIIGGANWTTGQVDTLLSNATKTSGALGIDTTNGNLTQWTAFTTTNLGSTLGINKLGANTLTLNQANTYTGGTTVSAGTLIATNGSALGTGNLTIVAGQTFRYMPTTAEALNIGGTYTLGAATAMNTALGGTLSQSVTAVTGAASLSGTGVVNIYGVPGVATTAGTHNLITAASGLTGGTYTLGAVYNNTDFTVSGFTRTATAISVTANSATALTSAYWKGGLVGNTGTWSASNGSTQSNWQASDGGGNQALTPGAGADLIFSVTASPGTMAGMTLGQNMTVKSLTINNTATAFGLNADGYALTIGSGGITIGAGVQTATIGAPVILGAAQTWTNNSANTLQVNTPGVTNGGFLLTIDGTGTTSFGVINNAAVTLSGSGGLTKNGNGRLSLGGTNSTYSGTTTLNGGVTIVNSLGSIGSGNLTLNGGVYEEYWTNTFSRPLGSGAGQVQIIGGASGFSENGGTGMTVNLGGAAATVVWGSSFFNPSTLVLQAASAQAASTLDFQNKVDLNGATRTVQVAKTSSITNGATMSGIISNGSSTAAGLTKTGPGILILSAANTFDGTTTISDGVLSLTSASALQNSPLDTTNSVAGSATVGLKTNQTTLALGGLIGNKDFDDTAGSVFTTASGGYNAVTAVTLNVAAANSLSYSGAIGNGAATTSLTKNGAGTQTLSGANTYTGATIVNGGTLLLDMTGSGALASTSALTLGGGNFTIKGKAGNVTAQTLGTFSLTANTGSTITLDSNGSTSTTLTLPNAAPTRGANSSLMIDLSSGNSFLTSTLGLAAGTQTNTQAILGYATVKDATGTGFAANVGGNIVRYTGSDALLAASNSATTNFSTSPTGTSTTGSPYLSGSVASPSYNSLSIDTAAATGANFLALNGTVTITQKALLMAGANDFTIQGGTLGAAASELIIHQTGSGILTVNSLIGSTSASLVKDGAGTLVVGGNNTFTGAVFVNEGALRLNHANASGTNAGGVTVQNGAALELSGGNTFVADALTIAGSGISSGGALRNVAGSNTYQGAITIGSGGARINADSSTTLNVRGITTAAGANVTFGGAGDIIHTTTAISGAGALIKDGSGTLSLNVASSYTGPTTISGGVLSVNSSLASSSTTVQLGGTLKGSGTIAGTVTVQNGGTIATGNSIESLATGALSLDAGSTFAFELNNDAIPNLSGDLTAVTGNLTIAPTNDALLTLTELGAGSWASEKLTLISYSGTWNGGLLDYLGADILDDSTITLGGDTWLFNYNDTTKGDNYTADATGTSFVTMTVQPVPEPHTALLTGLGLLALLRRRRA